jgi:hypothetical protein
MTKINRKQFSDFSVMERLREKETAAPQVGSSSLQLFFASSVSQNKKFHGRTPF